MFFHRWHNRYFDKEIGNFKRGSHGNLIRLSNILFEQFLSKEAPKAAPVFWWGPKKHRDGAQHVV
jgi:hypothetical protein